jgi:hypothetical protein
MAKIIGVNHKILWMNAIVYRVMITILEAGFFWFITGRLMFAIGASIGWNIFNTLFYYLYHYIFERNFEAHIHE